MGIAPHRVEQPFQPVKRGARVADDLLAIQDRVDARQPQRVDDHHRAAIGAFRRRALGQPGVGRLRDHDAARVHAQPQDAPHLDQGAGADHGLGLAPARAIAHAEAFSVAGPRQDMGRAHHPAQGIEELRRGGDCREGDRVVVGMLRHGPRAPGRGRVASGPDEDDVQEAGAVGAPDIAALDVGGAAGAGDQDGVAGLRRPLHRGGIVF